LAHPQYKAPLPKEPEPIVLEGTSERPPTTLEFKGTYENDLAVLCAVCVSNTLVRLGLDPLDVSDWAKARFAELTAVNYLPEEK
jgi:hypothetical protein